MDLQRRFGIPERSSFEHIFRNFDPGNGFPEQFRNDRLREGLGSRFILDPDGWLVTNQHVVDGADTVTVRLSDGRIFDAEVVGADDKTDLALLRIEADEALH
jgi:serine protease Do